MNNFNTIVRIELIKLMKRRDWLVLLALCAINILFGFSVFTSSYTGLAEQSAFYWIVSQVFNTSALFIGPIAMAYLAVNLLANEITSGSILLYTYRLKDKKRMYYGKSLAILIFSILIFIICVFINIAIYYMAYFAGAKSFLSGIFFGNNTLLLLLTLVMLYLSSYLLAIQFALFLSTYFKGGIVLGIQFFIVLIVHYTYKLPIIREFNPWYYIIRVSNDVMESTGKVYTDSSQMLIMFLKEVLLCFIYIFIFNILGSKKLKDSDL